MIGCAQTEWSAMTGRGVFSEVFQHINLSWTCNLMYRPADVMSVGGIAIPGSIESICTMYLMYSSQLCRRFVRVT